MISIDTIVKMTIYWTYSRKRRTNYHLATMYVVRT